MAQEQDFQFSNVLILKGEENTLGTGSYGVVYKASCDELPCAAKLLHPILFQSSDPNSVRLLQRFEQECDFMKYIKHPNIVQYLGMTRDPESRLPVLLMELLDESLTKFLEKSQEPLPYHVQVDLNHDIAIAIAHLHSRGIIHRDLSSNNVLLIARSRAKVTDFGMSKLADTISTHHSLTRCPGTEVYMPPEAMLEPPFYTKKIDCFSFGVLIIQTITRLFPSPGPRMTNIEDPRSPTGMISMPVLETERRENHISLIDPNHPLLLIARKCLIYNQAERPTAQQLCYQLASLKTVDKYIESKQHLQHDQSNSIKKDRLIQDMIKQIQEKDDQIQAKDDQIQAKDREIEQIRQIAEDRGEEIRGQLESTQNQLKSVMYPVEDRERQLRELNDQLQGNEQVITDFQHTLAQREREVEDRERQLRELNDQLQGNEQVITDFQHTLAQREREIEDKDIQIQELQRQIQQVGEERQQPQAQGAATNEKINFTWRKAGKIPFKEPSLLAVAVDGTTAYIRDISNCNIYQYDSKNEEWTKLTHPPITGFPLIVINGLLTAVGGYDNEKDTNTLLSLVGEKANLKWVEKFPAMPTKRYASSAVTNGKIMVVAGGKAGEDKPVNTVEVLNIVSCQWYTANELPSPLYEASASICGEHLYLVGGKARNHWPTKTVSTCSLNDLLLSAKPATFSAKLLFKDELQVRVWHKIANLPVSDSTGVNIKGKLVAIGGRDNDKPSNIIYKYNPANNSWDDISHMPIATARSASLVALFTDNKLMVVGGYEIEFLNKTDSVEIAETS